MFFANTGKKSLSNLVEAFYCGIDGGYDIVSVYNISSIIKEGKIINYFSKFICSYYNCRFDFLSDTSFTRVN